MEKPWDNITFASHLNLDTNCFDTLIAFLIFFPKKLILKQLISGERSGSVVECLTRDRRVVGSSLTGITVLWSLSKTH